FYLKGLSKHFLFFYNIIIIIRYINLGRILNMKRYEQFSFVISAICAFILLLNLVNVINLSSLINTLLTILTIVTIATFNIRNSKFIGLILYAIFTLMIELYLSNELIYNNFNKSEKFLLKK